MQPGALLVSSWHIYLRLAWKFGKVHWVVIFRLYGYLYIVKHYIVHSRGHIYISWSERYQNVEFFNTCDCFIKCGMGPRM